MNQDYTFKHTELCVINLRLSPVILSKWVLFDWSEISRYLVEKLEEKSEMEYVESVNNKIEK